MHTDSPETRDPKDNGLADFVAARPRLFGIAYRILGSVAEAEDVVQDVWLRWQVAGRGAVRDAAAFLATTTTRAAINVAQSARARRETYVGSWLPEPVSTRDDPHLGAERGDALEFAVLLLMEKLTPTERASYVLREAFDYSYQQIAEILNLSEVNVRQLTSRARKHISDGRQASVSMSERQRLLDAFLGAAQQGDLQGLENIFAADVMSSADGGGIVRATRTPVAGRERVAQFIAALASHYWTGTELTRVEANGQPAVLLSRSGEVVGFLTIEASAEGIQHLLWIMRPSKLAGFRV